MHEWSLAYAVVSTSIEHCLKQGRKQATATIELGELQQIDREIFQEALKEISSEQTECALSFEIEIKPAKFKCRKCGKEWSFDEEQKKLKEDNQEFIHFVPEVVHSFTRCPKCKSPDFEVVVGRGVSIKEFS